MDLYAWHYIAHFRRPLKDPAQIDKQLGLNIV